MNAFHVLSRWLCRCLEVVNILIALPFGAGVYIFTVDYLKGILPASIELPFELNATLYEREIAGEVLAVMLALIAVIYINGGVAQALDKRRFLEYISQSVDDLEQESQSTRQVTIVDRYDRQR